MSIPTTVGGIVERIAAIHAQFADTLAGIGDAQLAEPRLDDGRSGKDLLAHLAFWDQRLLHAVAPEGGPDVNRRAPPLIADIPIDEHWADTVNERIFALFRDRDVASVKREFAETCAKLQATVAGLSEHDVFDADGLTALVGEPFLPMVTGAYEHYEDHLSDLRRIAAG